MSEVQSLYGGAVNRRVRTRDLIAAKERGERWPMLTAYDMYSAEIFDEAGIPVLLVGDSAANNVYGHSNTLPVTVDPAATSQAAGIVGERVYGTVGGKDGVAAPVVWTLRSGAAPDR